MSLGRWSGAFWSPTEVARLKYGRGSSRWRRIWASQIPPHAFRGPSPRSVIMFGPAGHLYVYLSYGMHHCANLVTETSGTAGAVLLRAAAVEAGVETVRRRRGALAVPPADVALLRGPGNLCRGLGLSRVDNGLDVTAADARLQLHDGSGAVPVVTTPRIGISQARELPFRFAWDGHPAVSAPRPRH